jgi:ankyrin repeat protein
VAAVLPVSPAQRLCFAFILIAVVAAAAADDPWTRAISRRDTATLIHLVEQGADVNRATDDGRTALMLAASERHGPLVHALLARGADVNAANTRGGTALMNAAAAGDEDVVRLLLARGAAVNARASIGWTPLALAATSGHAAVVRLLLGHGADPNRADVYGWTALMRAVEQNRPAAARALLGAPAVNVNARDEHGGTALHHAAALGSKEIAGMLLEHGADRRARDRDGRTPAMIAVAQGYAALARALEPRGQQ